MRYKQPTFEEIFNGVQEWIHEINVENGFYEEDAFNVGEKVMLVVTELSEGIEAHREGNPPDDKIPEYDGLTAELADAVIRIMDLAEYLNLPLAEAIIEKTKYNSQRDYKHGKSY